MTVACMAANSMRCGCVVSGSSLPSLTSTDKSVCATPSCRARRTLLNARARVAQTLLSVLWRCAASDLLSASSPAHPLTNARPRRISSRVFTGGHHGWCSTSDSNHLLPRLFHDGGAHRLVVREREEPPRGVAGGRADASHRQIQQ